MPISAELLQRIRDNDPTLTSVNLFSFANKIGDEEVQEIAAALQHNTTLTSINLFGNKIGIAGAQAFAAALQHNTTLTSVNLACNHRIGDEGAQAIATALQHNRTLTSINLTDIQIGIAGTQAFADALQHNTTLTSINLTFNHRIGDEEAQEAAEELRYNRPVNGFNFAMNNPFRIDEGYQALFRISEITQRNQNFPNTIADKIFNRLKGNNSPETKLSDLENQFISNDLHPENCARILNNLVSNVRNPDLIGGFLTELERLPEGRRILVTTALAPNSLGHSLPRDKKEAVITKLNQLDLKDLFKVKGVKKDFFRDASQITNLPDVILRNIFEYSKVGDIKKEEEAAAVEGVSANSSAARTNTNTSSSNPNTSVTASTRVRRSTALVAPTPSGCCTIS